MPQEAILSIAGIITGLTVIFGALLAMYKIIKRLDQALAVDGEGRTISDRMSRVEHQLWKNGGDSLADEVGETHRIASETATEVRMMKDILLTLIGQAPATESKPKPRRRGSAAPAFGLQTFDPNE